MHHLILKMLQIELAAGSSHVALAIPIALESPIAHCEQHVYSNIKLPSVVQQWVCNILLKNVSSSTLLTVENLSHCREAVAAGDPTASVGMLSWFDYPYAAALLSLAVIKCFHELMVYRVVDSTLNVKGQRNYPEHIDMLQLTVLFQQIKQCLFVSKDSVIGQMIELK
mgnify:CR=1 FL=1